MGDIIVNNQGAVRSITINGFPVDGSLSIKDILDRPQTALTPKVLAKLEEGFKNDFTISEACHFAGINIDTYEAYVRASTEFLNQMELAKDFLFQVAKNNLSKAVIDGEVETSKWLLERRRKKLYSPRSEVTGNEGEAVQANILLGSINSLLGDSVKKRKDEKKDVDTIQKPTIDVTTP